MKTISQKNLFRLEKFGGILINKETFSRKELSEEEAIFLYLVTKIGLDESVQYYRKIGKLSLITDISKTDIFENANASDGKKEVEEYIFEATEKINELKRLNILSFPLELVIYPSMYCDLKCGFCFLANRMDKYAKNAEEWGNILKQAKDNGVLSVSILGGEPTRYYDIDKLLKICDDLHLNTTITTNAQSIKKSTVEIIEQSQYIVPVLSLQTLDSPLSFELMGVRPDRQLNLIKYFNSKGKRCRVNAVYTKQTIEQMKELADFCDNNGVERFSIANYTEVTGYTKIKKIFNIHDLRRLNEEIVQYLEGKGSKMLFATEGCHLFTAYPELVNDDIQFTQFNEMYFGCRAKYTKMEILSNGDILPCIAFLSVKDNRDNAFDSNLLNVWYNNVLYKNIREFYTKNIRCQKCALIKICEGGCYVNLIRHRNAEYIRDEVCDL